MAVCGGNIGGFCKLHRAVKRMQSRACHNLRAVYQRKPFLCGKLHRWYARPRHGVRAAHAFAVIHGLALYHNQHHVRKGRKVSARAKAALLRYYGMHARVEHCYKRFNRAPAYAGIAAAERIAS